MKLTALILLSVLPLTTSLPTLLTLAHSPTRAGSPNAKQQEPQAKANAQQTATRTATVIFLRHAEAQPRTRANQNPDLAEPGKALADRIQNTLRAAGVTRIFATELGRTQQTAAPLAKSLGLKVEQYQARDSEAFAKQLRHLQHGEVVVVVGHSNTVPVMVQELGGKLQGLDAKGYLQDNEHDRMIVQVLSSEAPDVAIRALQTLDLRIP